MWIELDVAAGRNEDAEAGHEVELDRAGGPIVNLDPIVAEGEAVRNAAARRDRRDHGQPDDQPTRPACECHAKEGSATHDPPRKARLVLGPTPELASDTGDCAVGDLVAHRLDGTEVARRGTKICIGDAWRVESATVFLVLFIVAVMLGSPMR